MDKELSTTTTSPIPPHRLSAAVPVIIDSEASVTATACRPPLSSRRLGDTKAQDFSRSPTTRPSPVPQQNTWSSSSQQQNCFSSTPKKPELNSFFNRVKEGQRVPLTVQDGAEFENIYDSSPVESIPTLSHSRMVQKKTSGPTDTMNGSGKRQSAMAYSRGGMNKAQNGSRTSFQTDTGISAGRLGDRRELQRWDAGGSSSSNGLNDGGLEDSTDSKKPWDQFAVNEEKFGVRTDYDENLYTTAIDRSRPDYNDRVARAEKLARKIEGSAPASAHTAEERVMDHVTGPDDGQDEEDKYSGVKRADFPPLTGQGSNKYTPPARRAPTGQATVKGAPVDPAIISSQLRAPTGETATPKAEEEKSTVPKTAVEASKADTAATEPANKDAHKDATKASESANKSQLDSKNEKTAALRASLTTPRNASPAKESQPIEKEVHKAFKTFAQKERLGAREKQEDAKKKKLKELMNFSQTFKLGTPVPTDLITIIAKDPKRQAEIQEKAKKNADEVQRNNKEKKSEAAAKEQVPLAAKPALSTKSSEQAAAPSTATATTNAPDTRAAARSAGPPPHANIPGAGPNRHPASNRQSYGPGSYQQQFRGDRPPGQNMPRHSQQGGHMAQHLRNSEQQRMTQAPLRMNPDMRIPPTGPASSMGPGGPMFGPRHTGIPPMGPPRLNPNTQEFRPNAQPFFPTGPSAASSPRSALNNVDQGIATPVSEAPRFRKVRAIDVKKCNILSRVQSYQPPQTTNKSVWEENGLRPPYDFPITWKAVQTAEENKTSWKEQFERPPVASVMATPNTAPVVPQQMPHQHQLPFHLQQGAQNAGPRQSPHIPPIPLQGGHPGHVPHMPFNNGDDGTRMMHSNSSQSYASPRPGQVPMAFPPNMMNSPSHMQYSQPVMPGFMGPGAPQMTPRMGFQNPQYMPQQHGQMGPPMMMTPQGYMPGPSPMMQGAPQMQMGYPNAHPNFVPPGAVPPQAMQGANGYPSPGRPAAPMMAHQGSQQGQHVYGMSPGAMPHFQQPQFPQQPGQMGNMRVHSNPGQQVAASPQQVHQYGPQQNRGNGYGGKNFPGPHQGPSPTQNGPGAPQARVSDGQDEAK